MRERRDWRGKVEPLARADRGPQDVLEGSEQAVVARAALLRDIDKVRIACTRLREQLAPFAPFAPFAQ